MWAVPLVALSDRGDAGKCRAILLARSRIYPYGRAHKSQALIHSYRLRIEQTRVHGPGLSYSEGGLLRQLARYQCVHSYWLSGPKVPHSG